LSPPKADAVVRCFPLLAILPEAAPFTLKSVATNL